MGKIQAPDQALTDRLERMVEQYEKDLLRICCMYLRDWKAAETCAAHPGRGLRAPCTPAPGPSALDPFCDTQSYRTELLPHEA